MTQPASLSPPQSACVVFAPSEYDVALVVERTAEYLIRVALQNLQALARQRVPHPRSFVTACRQNPRSLRIENDFRDFPFVAFQFAYTLLGGASVHATRSIGRTRS